MKTSHLNKVAMMIIVAVSLGACSAKIEGTGTGAGPGEVPVPPPVDTFSELQGNWTTGCTPYSGIYVKIDMTLGTSAISTSATAYGDAACTNAFGPATVESGVYKITGSVTTPTGATGIDYDFTNSNGTHRLVYDIYKFESGKLHMGKDPGETPSTRPTQFDAVLMFTKI